jgi:hypothetical protein
VQQCIEQTWDSWIIATQQQNNTLRGRNNQSGRCQLDRAIAEGFHKIIAIGTVKTKDPTDNSGYQTHRHELRGNLGQIIAFGNNAPPNPDDTKQQG